MESGGCEILRTGKILQTFFFNFRFISCLVLILAFSVLKAVQSPLTARYRADDNTRKSKTKSRFELENHGNVIKTKETGHSDAVRTFFLWFLSKPASSKTRLILRGILVFGRAPRPGAAAASWFAPSPRCREMRQGCSASPTLRCPSASSWRGPRLTLIFKALK